MKLMLLCAVTVAVAGAVVAAPQSVQLLEYQSDNDGLGAYSFAYKLSDGSTRNEEGELRNAGAEDEFVAVSGSYSWIGPDGVTYSNNYIADEKGYRVSTINGPVGSPPAAVVALLLG